MSSTQQQQQTRRFDHIYDPTFTASGYRDHNKATQIAMKNNFQKIPVHDNMFSEIPSLYQSHQYRTNAGNDLPAHVDSSYKGVTQTGSASIDAVSGANRYKYFRRPVVPVLHSAPPEYLLARVHDGNLHDDVDAESNAHATEEEDVVRGANGPVSRGMQTVFRESEAQTDPYTPDYIIPAGANPEPEILTLAGLTHKKGLPATLQEVEMIERAREKKKFLASLPPITDEASFNLRKRMMEEQELRDFQYREQDIDKMQAEHLRLIKQALEDREAETQFFSDQRIEILRQSKLEDKDAKLLEIQRKRIKQLRKLAKARGTVDPKHPSHAIIDTYSNYASKMYAPVVRDGVGKAPANNAETKDVELLYLDDFSGLMHLEGSIQGKHTQAKTKRPRRSQVRSAEERKRQNIIKHLDWMDDLIKTRKGGPKSPSSPGAVNHQAGTVEEAVEKDEEANTQWRRRAERLVRPPTPKANHVDHADQEDDNSAIENVESAVTLLQRLLRGRAIQMMMHEGKVKRQELIRELRTEEILAAQKKEAEEESLNAEIRNQEEKANDAAWNAVQGEVVSSTIDLLSKELVRMKQEQELRGMVADAMETRRRREMFQAGTRQAEQEQRDREDQVYRQLMLVHQATADSYFDEILGDSIETAAFEQARVDVDVPRPSSATSEPEQGRKVITELVSSFLLPHVQRESVRTQLEQQERRFVHAAHKSIYDMMQEIEGTGEHSDGLGSSKSLTRPDWDGTHDN